MPANLIEMVDTFDFTGEFRILHGADRCSFVVEPRVATQRFFESTLNFISDVVTEPTVKASIYEHLQSQMKSNISTLAPQTFIQDYVPEAYKEPYREYLQEAKIPLTQFQVDAVDIKKSLERKYYRTKKVGSSLSLLMSALRFIQKTSL
jgi:hypothetical protein